MAKDSCGFSNRITSEGGGGEMEGAGFPRLAYKVEAVAGQVLAKLGENLPRMDSWHDLAWWIGTLCREGGDGRGVSLRSFSPLLSLSIFSTLVLLCNLVVEVIHLLLGLRSFPRKIDCVRIVYFVVL